MSGPDGELATERLAAELARLREAATQDPGRSAREGDTVPAKMTKVTKIARVGTASSSMAPSRAERAGRNGDTPPAAGERRLILTPASKITPRPVRWVWDTTPQGAGPTQTQGRFPAGSLVLAVGRAGLGKSQFTVWLAAQLTRGTLPGCHHRSPRSVIYCTTEDSWEMTIVPRMLAAGADLDRVFHVRVAVDGDPHAQLTLPVDTCLLEAAIADHEVALVVLDPLLSLMDHTINEYRAREVRHALEPVVAVADRTRCLFVGLAHFTKATGGDPLLLVSGSGAFGQLIRAGVGFAADEAADADTETFVLSQIKNNLGRERLPSLAYVLEPKVVDTPEGPSGVTRFRFTGESERSVHDLLRGTGADDEKTERDEAAEWLRDYLGRQANREAPAKAVFADGQAAGFAKHTLQRARKQAGARTQKSDFGGGWVWALPLDTAPEGDAKTTRPLHVQSSSPSSSSLSPSGASQDGRDGQAPDPLARRRQLVDAITFDAGGSPEDHADAQRLAAEAPDLAMLIDPTGDPPTIPPWGDLAPLAWALIELERRTTTPTPAESATSTQALPSGDAVPAPADLAEREPDPAACPAHARWPATTWRCAVPGCPGSQPRPAEPAGAQPAAPTPATAPPGGQRPP